ncbi:MAG: S8 family serine peptidase, partial [Anaerolineales bacterium]|nr:S8 family serine peptidase [Anaerolineales bacterium]
MTKRLAILLTALLTLWALFAPAFASSPRSLKQLQKPALLQPLTADQLEKAASKLDPELLAALQTADPATPLTVIVRLGGQADLSSAADLTAKTARGAFVYQALQAYARRAQAGLQAELATAVRASLAGDIRPFFITNAVAVTARPDLVWHLALRDDVETITPNRIYQLEAGRPAAAPSIPRQSAAAASPTAEWNIAQINADDVWTQYGIDGRGILVANLDSGVDFQHPALVNQYAGNLGGGSFDHDYHWYDATDQMLPVPYDDNGHGTHTMGTTVGGDGPGPFADDIGVAPGATWIAVKAFTYDGYATTADIHEAYEWLLAPCPAGVAPGSIECDPARA